MIRIMIRFFDIIFSIMGLVILSPLFIVLYLLIRLESKGGGFYSQERIGKTASHSNSINSDL